MKTAISLPDEVFSKAEQAARKEGVSRSQFYSNAIMFYIQHEATSDKVSQINTLVDELGGSAFQIGNSTSQSQSAMLEDEGW